MRRVRLLPIPQRETQLGCVLGVASGAIYDPAIELLFDECEQPTVSLMALSPYATSKMSVVGFAQYEDTSSAWA